MACGTIADNDLQGNDGNLLDEGFPVAQFFYKMGGDAFPFQHLHQIVGQLVVDHTFACDGAFFGAVESRGVILVVHDHQIGIVCCKYFFCLSFVELRLLFHKTPSFLQCRIYLAKNNSDRVIGSTYWPSL